MRIIVTLLILLSLGSLGVFLYQTNMKKGVPSDTPPVVIKNDNPICDQIAGADTHTPEFIAERSPLPITCTFVIDQAVLPFVFTLHEDGRIGVGEQGNAPTILSYEGEGFQIYDIGSGETRTFFPYSFRLVDVTYDGHKDIEVTVSQGAYNTFTAYLAYDPLRHMYTQTPLLEGTNSTVHKETKEISFFAKGRGLGDMYVAETYRWEDSAYTLIARETQDMIPCEDECSSQKYLRTREERVEGTLVTTKTETFSQEELFEQE